MAPNVGIDSYVEVCIVLLFRQFPQLLLQVRRVILKVKQRVLSAGGVMGVVLFVVTKGGLLQLSIDILLAGLLQLSLLISMHLVQLALQLLHLCITVRLLVTELNLLRLHCCASLLQGDAGPLLLHKAALPLQQLLCGPQIDLLQVRNGVQQHRCAAGLKPVLCPIVVKGNLIVPPKVPGWVLRVDPISHGNLLIEQLAWHVVPRRAVLLCTQFPCQLLHGLVFPWRLLLLLLLRFPFQISEDVLRVKEFGVDHFGCLEADAHDENLGGGEAGGLRFGGVRLFKQLFHHVHEFIVLS
mmetsp:Transcript_20752/g.37086  ORF Transcript_20752/g.37086 Transcript_20752/m.37086 type:complete len:297 (+) Transcript_20752:1868-2758(+)